MALTDRKTFVRAKDPLITEVHVLSSRTITTLITPPMDEIIPNLWIGNLPSALDVEELKSKGIFSILTAMRGKVRINETFIRHQILLDDDEEADILVHFMPSITFIQSELDKGRGVLVHCQAGMSRSAAIVAAYLMYTQKIDPEEALKTIRAKRPIADPNPNFLDQLQVFYDAAFNVTGKSKEARRFYMNRTVEEVMNGDGTYDSSEFFAAAPPSRSPSTKEKMPRRRIRCKMCRHELAAREHMLDHGQLGDPTPAITPAASRRPSSSVHGDPSQPRRKSFGLSGSGLAMSSMTPQRQNVLNSFGMSSLQDSLTKEAATNSSAIDSESESDNDDSPRRMEAARQIGRKLSDAMRVRPDPPEAVIEETEKPALNNDGKAKEEEGMPSTHFSPSELVEKLNSDPRLKGRRGSSTTLVESPPPLSSQPSTSSASSVIFGKRAEEISPPILRNKDCSGYFLEPMKWMDPLLSSGELAGKIACPNPKCGVKLGNYDWAGLKCGCKKWVVPGFCISRSKVDEIVR